MDTSSFRLCGFRDFCKPVANQACAIVRRLGDYLTGDPALLLLAEAKPDLLAPCRDRKTSGAVALTRDRFGSKYDLGCRTLRAFRRVV